MHNQPCLPDIDLIPCPVLLLRISLHPVLRVLIKACAILAVLVGDGGLDGIVWVGLDEERLDEAQDRDDLVWRLPFVWAKQTETHGPFVVVAHVGVVNLGAEADDWRLEGVFGREGDFELEVAALQALAVAFGACASRVSRGNLKHTA